MQMTMAVRMTRAATMRPPKTKKMATKALMIVSVATMTFLIGHSITTVEKSLVQKITYAMLATSIIPSWISWK